MSAADPRQCSDNNGPYISIVFTILEIQCRGNAAIVIQFGFGRSRREECQTGAKIDNTYGA